MKIKAGIIGATGYAGAELVRILLTHPNAEIAAISSVSFEGKKLSEVYPSYKSLCDMECGTQEEVVAKSDVIFAALPHGLSQELAAECDKQGKAFIDLGADFRLEIRRLCSAIWALDVVGTRLGPRCSRPSMTSVQFWIRLSGSFSSSWETSSENIGGTSGFRCESGSNGSCNCLSMTSLARSPGKGGLPARAW